MSFVSRQQERNEILKELRKELSRELRAAAAWLARFKHPELYGLYSTKEIPPQLIYDYLQMELYRQKHIRNLEYWQRQAKDEMDINRLASIKVRVQSMIDVIKNDADVLVAKFGDLEPFQKNPYAESLKGYETTPNVREIFGLEEEKTEKKSKRQRELTDEDVLLNEQQST